AAKNTFEESLAIYREVGSKAGVATALNNIATLMTRRSDLRGARQAAEESLAIRREIGNKLGIGTTLRNLARVSLLQGNLVDARKQLEEALTIQNESGAKAEALFTTYMLASVFLANNQADRAEDLAREATEELRSRKSDSESNARTVLAESQL